MRVLLTGANGFVGSHVLDRLLASDLAVSVLLRPTSDTRFIALHLPRVRRCPGSVADPASLDAALAEVTHVIHCAGLTRALRATEFFDVNQTGTRHLVDAINGRAAEVTRFVHISSLAASHPAAAARPARESDPSAPVSDYGRSKLAAEDEIRERCRVPFVILRPPGVYGPRDREFLRLFKAVRARVLPLFDGGHQALSLVFARDLAEAAMLALTHPAVPGRTYNVAAPGLVTAGTLARAIAEALGVRPWPLPLPSVALYPVCALQEWIATRTGRPSLLTRQKYRELRAPGWTCDVSRLQADAGFTCPTDLRAGLGSTVAWYRQEGWL